MHWRTPGPDVGRDIEGIFDTQDFSGSITSETWYVECKRHSATVDWPTVYGKLAYADIQKADYLLLCTTGSLSPQCKDQVAAHDHARRTPRIRSWEGATLERIVAEEPILLSKYGLTKLQRDRQLSALPFLQLLGKTVHQVYGEAATPTASIELAAALAELAAVYLSAPEQPAPSEPHPLDEERDIYRWAEVTDRSTLAAWDSYAVRALLTAMRFVSKSDKVHVEFSKRKDIPCLRITPAPDLNSRTAQTFLNQLSIYADWEWSIDHNVLVVIPRDT